MLSPEAVEALAQLSPAPHIELSPSQMVDGNAFFVVVGWIVPRAIPAIGEPALILTNSRPLHILYPTLGLAGRDLLVECEGDLNGDYEVNVGSLHEAGDWTNSADITVKAKNNRIKFLAGTEGITPGELLAISISQVRRVKKGEVLNFFGIKMVATEDSISHGNVEYHRCTVDWLD